MQNTQESTIDTTMNTAKTDKYLTYIVLWKQPKQTSIWHSVVDGFSKYSWFLLTIIKSSWRFLCNTGLTWNMSIRVDFPSRKFLYILCILIPSYYSLHQNILHCEPSIPSSFFLNRAQKIPWSFKCALWSFLSACKVSKSLISS